MIAIISLLVTLTLSLLVTRVASMALMLTGLSRDAARFQARSAFSGAGFTTEESESIVEHPVRRQIIMVLMLLGNLQIAAVAATGMASLYEFGNESERWIALSILSLGLLGLWTFARSRWVERQLNKVISYALRKLAKLEVRDYVAILQLQNGYAVSELIVEEQDWIADKSLMELRLPDEGVLVLGVQRSGGNYIGAPTADTEIRCGDRLILYGPLYRIDELDRRRKGQYGDAAHEEAVDHHEDVIDEQEESDEEGST